MPFIGRHFCPATRADDMGNMGKISPEADPAALEEQPRHREARVWLRMLVCANLIENQLRECLRTGFDTTLARFDVIAQLSRPPLEPTMGELSKRLMLTKGSLTDVIGRMEALGLVQRRRDAEDARVQLVRLTDKGRQLAARTIPSHNQRLSELFDGFQPGDLEQLDELLGRLRVVLRETVQRPAGEP